MLDNLPEELRHLKQWCGAGEDGAPVSPVWKREDGSPFLAKVNHPDSWGTLEQAQALGLPYVGIVLSKDDPYCIIDLDDKVYAPAPEAEKERFQLMIQTFQTYTEVSRSGRGYHLICKAVLPENAGRRRGHVEVYNSGRFMIMTGNRINQLAIEDKQSLVEQMASQMYEATVTSNLTENEEQYRDQFIVDMAEAAENGDKYLLLAQGKWQEIRFPDGTGYPSQSEADFGFMTMLAFYSNSNEQCRRLFRYSALGRRDKAIRDNKHLDRMLKKIRAKQLPPIDFEEVQRRAEEIIQTMQRPSNLQPHTHGEPLVGETGGTVTNAPPPLNETEQTDTKAPAPPVLGSVGEQLPPAPPSDDGRGIQTPVPLPVGTYPQPENLDGIPCPPGLVGEIARYSYATAIRPVWRVSVATALGLVAGITGRQFNISNAGLNLYIMLVAETGRGKEETSSLVSRMMASIAFSNPSAEQDFIGPSSFSAGQTVIKQLNERPCLLSTFGEAGIWMKALSGQQANEHKDSLKRALLDIYTKSGKHGRVSPLAYSDKEKNTQTVFAPCLTLLGETSPGPLYDNLNGQMVKEGFLPRWCIVEYKGDRPRRQKQWGTMPSETLATWFGNVVGTVQTMALQSNVIDVDYTAEGLALLDQFDVEADDAINQADDSVIGELWNRAHLKALKIAGVLAVGVNHFNPLVDEACAKWAIDLVRNDVQTIAARFDNAEVGEGEQVWESLIRETVKAYVHTKKGTRANTYKVPEALLENNTVIPFTYLRRRLKRHAAFYEDRRGATEAIRRALQDLCDGDVLELIPSQVMNERYGLKAAAYTFGKSW